MSDGQDVQDNDHSAVASAAFWLLLLTATLVRVWLATKGHSIRHPDEVLQTLEQSHRIVFGYGVVPWEYREGIRWLGTALMLTPPLWIARAFDLGPDFYVPLMRGLLALVSVAPFPLFYEVVRRHSGNLTAFLSCLLPLFWVEHLDFAGSTLSDAIAAPVLACAALLTLLLNKESRTGHVLILGVLLGVTFCLRFHLTPALVLIGVAALLRLDGSRRLAFLLSLVGSALCLGALDLALGQMPFQHVYLNVYRNLVDGVAEQYGTQDAFYYLRSIWDRWGPGILIPLGAIALRWKPSFLLWGSAVIVIVAFSAIEHKEYRFYYPATLLFTLAGGWALADLSTKIGGTSGRRAMVTTCVATAVFLVQTVVPAGGRYMSLAEESEDPRIAAQMYAGQQHDICGLGYDIGLAVTGTAGLVHFHRNVAFDAIDVTPAGEDVVSRFNYVIVKENQGTAPAPYKVVQCWDDLCLSRRGGSCTPSPPTPDGPGPD